MKQRLLMTAAAMLCAAAVLFTGCDSAGSNGDSMLLAGLLASGGGPDMVTHFAGSDGGGAYRDGAGTDARFYGPGGITSDAENLYVVETYGDLIRKIVKSTGVVTTLASDASPYGITSDGTNLYVTDDESRILKIVIATGRKTILAGGAGIGMRDGIGTEARFNAPTGITFSGGNLYVADSLNHTIRKIVIATGAVSTLAGDPGESGSDNGTGTAARFNTPYGITADGTNTNLYVADSGNHTIRRVVIATGAVTTLAGTPGESGQDATHFNGPSHVTTDGTNLYVADRYNHAIRRVVIATGAVTTLAGSTSGVPGSANGTGSAARFSQPCGITYDGADLYVSDSGNHTIRHINLPGTEVSTPLGRVVENGDANGTGTAARFNTPCGAVSDGTALYVADTGNNTIRRIVIATGEVSTLAGSGDPDLVDGTGTEARFSGPRGIAFDGADLYVADTGNNAIRRIVIATGAVTTFAGSTAGLSGTTNAVGAQARFNGPRGIASDGINLYVADTGNHTIRKIVIDTRAVTTIAGNAGESGSSDGSTMWATFASPEGIACAGTDLYVADTGNKTIRRIDLDEEYVRTLAGKAGVSGGVDGIGSEARFKAPVGVTSDGARLYVTDSNRIRKISIATGEVVAIAGHMNVSGSRDGRGLDARFNSPAGIAYDRANRALFVADSLNHCIRRIE